MADTLSDETVSRVHEFVEDRDIYLVNCGGKDVWPECRDDRVARLTNGEEEAKKRFTSIRTGDILIAYAGTNRTSFYGIGVATEDYNPNFPTGESEAAEEVPARWVEINNMGEIFEELTDDFVSDAVETISSEEFVDFLCAAYAETDFIENGRVQFERLTAIADPRDILEILDGEFPDGWKARVTTKEAVLDVVWAFLTATDSHEDTETRLEEAQRIAADRANRDENRVEFDCTLAASPKTEDTSGDPEEWMPPILERIEARWNGEDPGPHPDEEYFALTTGNGRYNDDPESEYRFKNGNPGTKRLREAANNGRIVYYRGGEFFATAELGDVHLDESDNDGWDSYIKISNYEEFDPIPLDEVKPHLESDYPQQFGIVDVPYQDFLLMAGSSIAETTRPYERLQSDIEDLLTREAHQADLYREAFAHLVAGKNLLFYGPPGTGKTRAADLITEILCADSKLETANAEWSNHKVVGGYERVGSKWEATPGFLTEAVQDCRTSLEDGKLPEWLIIDEMNRANLDEAFGEVFTLLDLDYRDTESIDYGGEPVHVPLAFRIIGTMNTYDQAQLFSLGYAFRRRFAFVKVASLLDESTVPEVSGRPASALVSELSGRAQHVVKIIHNKIPVYFETGADDTPADVAPIFPKFAERGTAADARDQLLSDDELTRHGLDFIQVLAVFGERVTTLDVIDIGQALLIDAAKFVVAHQLLFPEETGWDTVDQAVLAYIVPQFEQFMSDLRRADTIEPESDADDRYEEVISLAEALELPRTVAALKDARETKQILGS